MPPKLVHDSYGKSDVRLTKVIRLPRRHDLIEISVDVTLVGDFQRTYLAGDNRSVIATDSMKNTIYVLAKQHPLDSVESYALHVVDHFLKTYKQVRQTYVTILQSSWKRIKVAGRPHPHAFVSGGNERRYCQASGAGRSRSISGGIRDLMVLKSTDSAFERFVRDRYTTLKDASDRIFATAVSATWFYENRRADYNAAFEAARRALLETFARHKSRSVQQTLYAMGQAALRRCRQISQISITMPNKHRLPVDLKPFGLANENDIFVWTDQPYGSIHGTIQRS
jgi:urate oxidase